MSVWPRRSGFYSGRANRRGQTDIRWHGLELDQPNWDDGGSRCLAFTLAGEEPLEPDLHVMMNMDDAPHDFAVPTADGRRWARFADTGRPSPDDIADPGQEQPFDGDRCTVQGRSIVVLTSSDS
jgi:glycogen operon protein